MTSGRDHIKKLQIIVLEEVKIHDGKATVDPETVADGVMRRLDRHDEAKFRFPMIYYAADLHVRHLCRSFLRRNHTEEKLKKTGSATHRDSAAPTFPFPEYTLLQRRYPRAHVKGKPKGYVLIEQMSFDDWQWNCSQLARECGSKDAHRVELIRWGKNIHGWEEAA